MLFIKEIFKTKPYGKVENKDMEKRQYTQIAGVLIPDKIGFKAKSINV